MKQALVHSPPVEVSDADVAEYWERGYWISPKIVDDDHIARLIEACDRIHRGERDSDNYAWYEWPKPPPGSAQLLQVTNGWWINREIRRLLDHPPIGYIASRLMKTPEVRLWHDQVLFKPGVPENCAAPEAGNVGWHQDYAHWQCCNTTNMCSAWIALQDTDLSNGGMRTIVGSHKWGLTEDAYTFGEKDLEGLRSKYAKGREWVDEPCVLKAGQASFHHALCFHGSGPNLSGEPRRSIITHMMPADCGLRTDGRWHLCATLMGPWAKTGDLFAGPFFPRMWPPSEAELQ